MHIYMAMKFFAGSQKGTLQSGLIHTMERALDPYLFRGMERSLIHSMDRSLFKEKVWIGIFLIVSLLCLRNDIRCRLMKNMECRPINLDMRFRRIKLPLVVFLFPEVLLSAKDTLTRLFPVKNGSGGMDRVWIGYGSVVEN